MARTAGKTQSMIEAIIKRIREEPSEHIMVECAHAQWAADLATRFAEACVDAGLSPRRLRHAPRTVHVGEARIDFVPELSGSTQDERSKDPRLKGSRARVYTDNSVFERYR